MLWFRNDYGIGAHPEVLRALTENNLTAQAGYSRDDACARAQALIREKTDCPAAQVYFISGGTQTNMIAISTLLRPWEAVIACNTGHINVHETGAIEATGHKVLTRPSADGKMTVSMIEEVVAEHTGHHMVKPAMVYISHPTELGTLYTLSELTALSEYCREKGLLLYLDGARLASALDASDITLPDIARLTDLFYIGGTKCGALFGEALVLTREDLAPDMLYSVKNRGGRFAKGFLMGEQFEALLKGDLYDEIGKAENDAAHFLRDRLKAKGYAFYVESDSNQIFPIMDRESMAKIEGKADYEVQKALDDGNTVIRLVTAWNTTKEDCAAFLSLL